MSAWRNSRQLKDSRLHGNPPLQSVMKLDPLSDVVVSSPHGTESPFLKLLLDSYQKLALAYVEEVERAHQFAPPVAHNELRPTSPGGDLTALRQRASSGAVRSEAAGGDVPIDGDDFTEVGEDPQVNRKLHNERAVHICDVAGPLTPSLEPHPGSDGDLAIAPPSLSSPFAASSKGMNTRVFAHHPLDVTLVEASGLRDADGMLFMGSSDPYVVCEVRDKPHTRFKTHVVNNNLRPVWNHEEIVTDFNEGDILDFTVLDCDFNITQDDVLGTAHLSWSDICVDGYFGALPLSKSRHAQDESAGVLVVQVALKAAEINAEHEAAQLEKLICAACDRWPLKREYDSANMPSSDGIMSLSLDSINKVSSHGAIIKGSGIQKYVVINPFGINAVCWNLVGIACVLTDVALVPLLMAFDLQDSAGIKMLSFALAIYWTLNIVRSFMTGVFLHGVIEMRFKPICLNYLKTWFVPDVALALIDWSSVIISQKESQEAGDETTMPKMVRVFRAVRFVRSLAVLRMFKINHAIEIYFDAIALAPLRCFMNVCGIVAAMLMFCHYLGCLWYYIGRDAGADGWVVNHRVDEGGRTYEYFCSIHWALTQFMPASSGIQAFNLNERIYVFIVDVIGFVCFSFFVSNVQMQLNSLKSRNADRMKQLAEMRAFFSDKRVPLSVATAVTEFVKKQHRAKKHKRLQDVSALQNLPAEMVRKLNTEIYKPLISCHPFMACVARLDRRCFARLCHEALQERSLPQGCRLFEQEAIATCMYFVTAGQLLYSRHVQNLQLSANDWAAEPVLWIKDWTHRGNMTAKRDCIVLELSEKVFSLHVCGGGERLRQFAKVYAAKFVRSGDRAEQYLSFSDVWSSHKELTDFATAAERFSGVAKTNR